MKQGITKWEATDTPGLYVRQPGGGFYARITVHGKRSWRSLKTDKKREAQRLLRDLQSGHTRQVSTRMDDRLHAAMAAVIEFRATRRGISRPLRKSTVNYHGEILASAKKLFADRPLGSFDKTAVIKSIGVCQVRAVLVALSAENREIGFVVGASGGEIEAALDAPVGAEAFVDAGRVNLSL